MLTINKKFRSQRGQSIIEVIIGAFVVAVVLTAVASALSLSVKNTAESKFRNLASSRAQEAMEIYYRERNIQGWDRFHEAVATGTYCLNDLPADSTAFNALSTGACSGGTTISGTTFTRQAEVQILGADEVSITISVTWDDSGDTREVIISQELREF